MSVKINNKQSSIESYILIKRLAGSLYVFTNNILLNNLKLTLIWFINIVFCLRMFSSGGLWLKF